MEAIILAGGFGTRLQKVVNDKPKSMAVINGKPFLEYLLNYLRGQGVTRVILSVGYLNDMITKHFGESHKNISIIYALENEPLGTGGGIKNAMKFADSDRVFVMNGDSMFRVDLSILLQTHISTQADITMALRKMDETDRYGTVMIDDNKRITGFREKGAESGPGLINGGIYIINRSFLEKYPEKFSIEKDCFESNYQSDNFYGHPFRGYFLDIGVPDDYERAQDEFKKFDD